MCGRGTVGSEANVNAPAYHAYKTTDLIAAVEAADYFPANFDFTSGCVLSDDVIFIVASDANGFYIIADADSAPEVTAVGA